MVIFDRRPKDFVAETQDTPFSPFSADMVVGWTHWNGYIPPTWAICNGVGETSSGKAIPDLSERYIKISGTESEIGDMGGRNNFNLRYADSHTHTVRDQGHALTLEEMPRHTHSHYTTNVGRFSRPLRRDEGNDATLHWFNRRAYGTYQTTAAGGNRYGETEKHYHNVTCTLAGMHTHKVEGLEPEYCKLMFLVKL